MRRVLGKKIIIGMLAAGLTTGGIIVQQTKHSSAEDMRIVKGDLVVELSDNMLITNVDTYLNIRFQPSGTAAVIGQLRKGDTVSKIGEEGEWTKIDVNGQTGYVYTKYTLTGSDLKKYIEDHIWDFKVESKQTGAPFEPVYYTEEDARENKAEYTMTGVVTKDAIEYVTKDTKLIISDQFDEVEKLIVNTKVLNLRAKSSTKSSIKKVLTQGTVCEIMNNGNSKWTKIRVNGITGYVSNSYVKKVKVKENKSNIAEHLEKGAILEVCDVEKKWITVKRNGGNFYIQRADCQVAASSIGNKGAHPVVGYMENDSDNIVYDVNKDVALVHLENGSVGYMKASLLQAQINSNGVELDQTTIEREEEKLAQEIIKTQEGTTELRKSLVDYALSFVGNKYVWGGTSLTQGADCSGFTQQIFKKYNVKLNRCSYQQVDNGKKIDFSQLQPGDLIFYYNKEKKRIGHVAIYMGDEMIVHAKSTADGITTSKWNYRTPYCAVNVLGDLEK